MSNAISKAQPRRITPIAVLVTGLGSAAVALAPAARADTTTVTFHSTGAEQTWTVPAGVTSVHVVAIGGRGGNSYDAYPGGYGADLEADLSVATGETLYVEVGGNGQSVKASGVPDHGLGGFNGGGDGDLVFGAGGGGASDLRTLPAADGIGSLDSRLLVAGGAGGAAFGGRGGSCAQASTGGSLDGCAGAPTGSSGTEGQPGAGGTQTDGGAGGAGANDGDGTAGTLGSGGSGGTDGDGGGGGGGGLYGGGGGGGGVTMAGGGGSGSSFVGSRAQLTSFGMDNTGTPEITLSYTLPAPLATTEQASEMGQTSATLDGVVNPEGFATSYHFEWGTSTAYEGTPTAETDVVPTDSGQHAVSATISDLTPGTQYHFRLVATNANGSTPGDDVVFTTAAAAPAGQAPMATTSPANHVGQHQATLNGVVNPEGATTTVYFQYGFSAKYGKTTAAQSIGSGTANVSVQALLSGLPRHTWFHFRVVAVNADGTTYGADRAFKTS